MRSRTSSNEPLLSVLGFTIETLEARAVKLEWNPGPRARTRRPGCYPMGYPRAHADLLLIGFCK
jgi:hypothetical protein